MMKEKLLLRKDGERNLIKKITFFFLRLVSYQHSCHKQASQFI